MWEERESVQREAVRYRLMLTQKINISLLLKAVSRIKKEAPHRDASYHINACFSLFISEIQSRSNRLLICLRSEPDSELCCIPRYCVHDIINIAYGLRKLSSALHLGDDDIGKDLHQHIVYIIRSE